ncbi:type III secretion system stator protein SctL [Acidovorax sp. SUPP2825]|uniref:type III secretion system stator protein SctL n=1 Tax=Acidovorax sp. SUPP2825 TaxID=2920879 RepID=UPI0023DE4F51|nr:type III secretion system stator protein SctL [Acidovorax sp. SUPP2825]GKS93441.1 type III secretion system stator protein SctL [Acidovorax sp. SUPP2825]
MLIWSNPSGAHLRTDTGILRAHEIPTVTGVLGLLESVRNECAAIREEAQAQALHTAEEAEQSAQALLQQAREEAEALVDEARREAAAERELGYAHGEREAAARWHGRFAQLKATHEAAWHAMDTQLAGVVALAVERIVQSESREALFRRALWTVKDALRQAGTASLRVHPDEADAARTAIASAVRGPNEPEVRVETDASLALGSCIFESDIGRLDTSLGVQLAGVRSALERATRLAMANASQEASTPPDPEEIEIEPLHEVQPPSAHEATEWLEAYEAEAEEAEEPLLPEDPLDTEEPVSEQTLVSVAPPLAQRADASPNWFSSAKPLEDEDDATDWLETLDPMNGTAGDGDDYEEKHHA